MWQACLASQNSNLAKGQISGPLTTRDILTNDQILKAEFYRPLIVGYHNGAAIQLSDIADVEDSVQNIRNSGYVNGKPCVNLHYFATAWRKYYWDCRSDPKGPPVAEGFDTRRDRRDDRRRSHDHNSRVGA